MCGVRAGAGIRGGGLGIEMAEDVLMAGDGLTDAVAGAADLVMEPGTEDTRNLQDEYKGYQTKRCLRFWMRNGMR